MAEAILSDIAGRIIENMGSLVFKEIQLTSEVRNEIKKLEETMRSIKAVLLDAEEQHGKKNHQVTEWLLRLKEAVYDADDLLDDFATQLQLPEEISGNRMAKEVQIFFSTFKQLPYCLKMGHKIKSIRERLDDTKSDRQFHLDENRVQNVEREQTHSAVVEKDVIGRDEDKNKIIQRLLVSNDVENISVIPIVGIGGLGKTTLAKLIYNDQKIKNNFQLRLWVCVSDVFDVRRIVKSIIKSASDKSVEGLDTMEELQKDLESKVNGKKYLLVLDDVWNENRESWLKLETLLINGMKGSKIVITTRSQRVAKITSTLPFHELKGLNEGQSWSLFSKMAFEHGMEPKGSNLLEMGKCIVKKCLGVPLAIRTIGRFLYYKNTEDYWVHFMKNELSQIADQEESDILPTLKLSYDHLPSHLKQCFAYCALFPKDYKIRKDYLVDLWMAQGFLPSSNMNKSLEEIGNEYFMNLLSRSFFQDIEYDKWGNVVNCKMHDLMHDLATIVAGIECTMLKVDATNYQAKARHISFDYKLDLSRKLPNALLEKNHIRTFLLPLDGYTNQWDEGLLNESNFKKFISSSKYLRTLDLIGLDIMELPDSMGKLKHLRYLDMSNNKRIRKLPNSMLRLRNLQVLKLNNCDSLKGHIPRLDQLPSLKSLMLNDLHNLKYLISEKGRKDSSFTSRTSFFPSLKLLEIRDCCNLRGWWRDVDKDNNHGAVDLPSFSCLSKLEIKHCLNLSCMPLYPSLEELSLWDASLQPLEQTMKLSTSSTVSATFSNLKSLYIRQVENLNFLNNVDDKQWKGFTSLNSITISDIPKMVSLPQGLQHVPNLQKLDIGYCPNLKDLPDGIQLQVS